MKRLLLILLISASCACMFATKRALVIGISEYRDTKWMKPRISAERDIYYVREILGKSGFESANISILKNQQATKSAIVSAMQQLASVSEPGDVIYIHFSGHGQLMTDLDGDEAPDIFGEQWDEAWVPYDASFHPDEYDQGELHLCDDEIGELLSSIKNQIGANGEILVVIDACHSGDATRQNDDRDEEFYETVGDTASYACTLPVTRGTFSNFEIEKQTTKQDKKQPKPVENWITISACKSEQVNSEMLDDQGRRIGMLTYGLYTLIPELSQISNDELEKYLVNFMSKNKHPKSLVGQDPQITGLRDIHNIHDTFLIQH